MQVDIFDADTLIYHRPLSCSWGSALVQSAVSLDECLHKIELPVLLYHGRDDSVVPLKSSQYIHDAISSTDKEHKVVYGSAINP